MAQYIKKGFRWSFVWWIIWVVMFVLVILAYPSSPSMIGGWFPSSIITTFGLMVVVFVLGKIFCNQRFKQ